MKYVNSKQIKKNISVKHSKENMRKSVKHFKLSESSGVGDELSRISNGWARESESSLGWA